MTSALETIRYHSGIAGEEVADMVDSLEQEASSLREQVEKLTAALKLSREALSDAMEWCICRDSNFYKPCEEALAAIDALKGE